MLNFRVKIMFKMMGLAQKSQNYVQNNGISSKRQNYKERLGNIKQKRQCWHQDLVHCTGWPVCTLRILWHSDGSCRGIPPRHLNSDIQPPRNPQWNLFIPGDTFCQGWFGYWQSWTDIECRSSSWAAGKEEHKNNLYLLCSILQYKMWFVCITALLINNPWLQWYHC